MVEMDDQALDLFVNRYHRRLRRSSWTRSTLPVGYIAAAAGLTVWAPLD